MNTEEDKRLLKILDDAYIEARYSADFSPSVSDLDLLFQKVQQLHGQAVIAVKERLNLAFL
ncbi:MAG TPA: hypothetical protein VL946_10075 [Lacibacter sp.]|nr:hypothetical protein [Lacibacter sp.]